MQKHVFDPLCLTIKIELKHLGMQFWCLVLCFNGQSFNDLMVSAINFDL